MDTARHTGWNRLIGQDRVEAALRRTVDSERIAHAYLFHGPDGTGKRAAAIALAETLQCRDRDGTDPCGRCADCHKAAKLVHPDIHVMMPTTTDADEEDVGARIKLLGSNSYDVVDYQRRPELDSESGSTNKQVLYNRESIGSGLRKTMSFRPVEGQYRIAILIDADRMRAEAANAFLKLLEEPGKKTVFILLTDQVDRLLPTILSRCQKIRFEPLGPGEIAAGLVRREHVDRSAADMLGRMADGSYSRARSLAGSEELLGSRDLVLDFLRHSWAGKGDVLVPFIDRMNRMGREPVKFLLQVLLTLLRDLYLVQKTGPDAPIVNVDKRDVLEKFSRGVPDARLEEMIEAVEQTAYLVERNVHSRLALVALSRSLGRSMHGERTGGLDVDLAAASS